MTRDVDDKNRRTFLGSVPAVLFGGWIDKDGDGEFLDDILGIPEKGIQKIDLYRGQERDLDDVIVKEDRVFLARDTGAVFVPDADDHDEWEKIPTTGLDQVLENVVVNNIQTKNIGVSVSQSQALNVDTGPSNETRLRIDNVESPFFDDFGELDEVNNKIILKHGSHHEVAAHCYMDSANSGGRVLLRIYVNGEEVAKVPESIKTGEDMGAALAIYLKLDEGDEVYATVQHNTGVTETFPSEGGNYVSSVRQ